MQDSEDYLQNIEPIWRGVFPIELPMEVLFTFAIKVKLDELPELPFTVELDLDRIIDEDDE